MIRFDISTKVTIPTAFIFALILCLGFWYPTQASSGTGLKEMSQGLDGIDCFEAVAMAADSETNRLYILCAATDQGSTDALMVLDNDTGDRLSTIFLEDPLYSSSRQSDSGHGQLALDPVARRLYISSNTLNGLMVLDTGTLTETGRLPDVERVTPAPGSDRFFSLHNGLRGYDAATLAEIVHISLGELPTSHSYSLLYNAANKQLYVVSGYSNDTKTGTIQIRNSDNLTLGTTVEISGGIRLAAVQANRIYVMTDPRQIPVEGELFTYTLSNHRLIMLDGDTQARVEIDLNEVGDEQHPFTNLLVDENTGQIHLMSASDWLQLDGETLAVLNRFQPPACQSSWQPLPQMAFDVSRQILSLSRGGEVIRRYNPDTGQPAGQLNLGRRLLNVTVHPTNGRLYTLDSLGALTVLDGPSLEPLNAWPNLLDVCPKSGYGMAIDPAQERLFISAQNNQTLVLNAETLTMAGTIPQAGPMTVDSTGGRLFIGQSARDYKHTAVVLTYDTTTLTEITSTENPEGKIAGLSGPGAGPYSSIAGLKFADPLGQLFIHTFSASGTSGGSCGGCSWQSYIIYNPNTMTQTTALHVNHESGRLGDLAFSSDGQRIFAGFQNPTSNSSGQEKFRRLVIFDKNHAVLKQTSGLFGPIATDDTYLYLWQDQHLMALDAQALESDNQPYFKSVLPVEYNYLDIALDKTQGRLYLWGPDYIGTISTADLLAQPVALNHQKTDEEDPLPTPQSLDLVSHLGGHPRAVAVQGNYAYVAFGSELAVLDISDPAKPERIGYVMLPVLPTEYEQITAVVAAGQHVYVGTKEAGLRVIDVSNPATPVEVGAYAPDIPWRAKHIKQIAAVGDYTYVSVHQQGLRVLDMSNPAVPTEVGFYEFGEIKDMVVSKIDNTVYGYVLTAEELNVLDISDSTQPTLLSVHQPDGDFSMVAVHNGYVYLGNRGGLREVVDVSEPATPVTVNTFDETTFSQIEGAKDMWVDGQRLYIIASQELQMLDISTPAKPIEVNRQETLGNVTVIADDYAYSLSGGLQIAAIPNPATPVGVYQTEPGSQLTIVDNYAYLANSYGLSVLEISDRANPGLVSFHQFAEKKDDLWGMVVAQQHLFLTNGYNGSLTIIDISNPATPIEIGLHEIPNARDLAAKENYLYISHYASYGSNLPNGIYIIDVSNPSQPKQVGFYQTPIGHLVIKGDTLGIYTSSTKWHFADISNPVDPKPIDRQYDLMSSSYEPFALADNYTYLVTSSYHPSGNYIGNLQVIDHSNSSEPVLVAARKVPARSGGLVAEGGYVYLANYSEGFFIFRLISHNK